MLSLLTALSFLFTVPYPLIAQRPDEGGAVHAPYERDPRLCCSAASASMTSLETGPRMLPFRDAYVSVILTAYHEDDAVRVRLYSFDAENHVTQNVYTPLVTSPTLGAPRPLAIDLTQALRARVESWTLVALEIQGAPVIYGATLKVTYEVQ